jgi:hypothetical protein
MLSTGLPVSRLVKVNVSMTTPAVIAPAINTCLLLGSSDVIDATERMRAYGNISEVASDFGTAAPEYLGAVAWFSQNPSPDNLFVGRWIKTASAGKLIGGALSPTEQLMTAWNAVTTGGFVVTIDGTLKTVTGLTFAAAGNLNAVAATITTALQTPSPVGTMVWNATLDRFELRSGTSGIASLVTFASAGTPTDISAMLKMRSTDVSAGAYTVAGKAPETALTAATTIDALYSSQWYALVCLGAVDADHQSLAAYCEAADPPHYYGVTTAAALVLVPTDSTDIGSVLSNFGYTKSAVQYSTMSPYAIMSYLGRILTTAWRGQNSTMSLMYKQEPGVGAEVISTTNANTLQNKHVNALVNYANGARMIQYGVCSSGDYTDTIIGADALAADIQNALFNVLYTTPSKVPQTDAGMGLLKNAAAAVCSGYVSNGFLAEGTWNAPGFGTLEQGDLLSIGFYVYAPSILLQSVGDRNARKAPVMTIAAKTAGAIHSAEVQIFVNQ